MPGWIVQWYWNVPADENVRENVAPGAIEPEFQAPPSAVDVCVTLSLFAHVTVPPTETVIGFGAGGRRDSGLTANSAGGWPAS